MTSSHTCPGCGHKEIAATFSIPNQPVVSNYRFASAGQASQVPHKDVDLAQCAACGLVFNATFDVGAIPYDERYENRQSCSPMFAVYLTQLARDLVTRYQLGGKRILEVGCGKGDFLKLICHESGALGVGYDTTYEGPPTDLNGQVQFYRAYVGAADIDRPFDLIVCRHVIEHVPAVGAFLGDLRAISQAASAKVTILETPSFEWIVGEGSFWDVFYEHCNYFSQPCLAYLAQRAGFQVAMHSLAFGSQYQRIDLSLGSTEERGTRPPGITRQSDLQEFTRKSAEVRRNLERRLCETGVSGGWAIWGAGAKGVALVTQLTLPPPSFVVDSNPAKQGGVIPGSRVPIIAPEDSRVREIPVILVANPQYLFEIKTKLAARGFRNTLLST